MIERFVSLWKRLGGIGKPEVYYEELTERYNEPGRFYHTLDHVFHCLNEFDGCRGMIVESDVVELALWYHDLVYDPRAKDNEEKSALYLVHAFRERGLLPVPALHRASYLILQTQHLTTRPDGPDAEYLVDIDLAILGAPTEVYERYEKNVRLEYPFVSDEDFKHGRNEFLRSFLSRPYLYYTEYFRDRYEDRARLNLSRARDRLN